MFCCFKYKRCHALTLIHNIFVCSEFLGCFQGTGVIEKSTVTSIYVEHPVSYIILYREYALIGYLPSRTYWIDKQCYLIPSLLWGNVAGRWIELSWLFRYQSYWQDEIDCVAMFRCGLHSSRWPDADYLADYMVHNQIITCVTSIGTSEQNKVSHPVNRVANWQSIQSQCDWLTQETELRIAIVGSAWKLSLLD